MKTLNVFGIDIAILPPSEEDKLVINFIKSGDILKQFKRSLIKSASYMAKDEFEIPLTDAEENVFEEQYLVRKNLHKQMKEIKSSMQISKKKLKL